MALNHTQHYSSLVMRAAEYFLVDTSDVLWLVNGVRRESRRVLLAVGSVSTVGASDDEVVTGEELFWIAVDFHISGLFVCATP